MFKPIVEQVQMRFEARTGARLGSCLEARGGDIVFVLPLAELLGELGGVPEDHVPIELVFFRPRAVLDLSIGLGASTRNLPVDDAEISQVPGEVGPKLGTVVSLDA